MSYRFLVALLPAHVHKLFLIVGAAIVLVLAWVAAGFASGGPWVYGADGVMMPDGKGQTPAPRASGPPTHRPGAGNSTDAMMPPAPHGAARGVDYTYTQPRSRSSVTLMRNGQPWVTVTHTADGSVVISDPNGPAGKVLTVVTKH